MAIDLQKYKLPQGTPKTGSIDLSKYQKQPEGASFEQEKPTSFLGKARDFTTSIIGGGKLAEGLGQAIAAPGVQKSLGESQNTAIQQQTEILKRIREARAKGEDTSRLMQALKENQKNIQSVGKSQTNFTDSLATNKEVLGSALRLGGTLAGGALAGGVSTGGSGTLQAGSTLARSGGLSGLFGKGTGLVSGAVRGAGSGATLGAVEGGIQGAGVGLEQNKDAMGVLQSSGTGAGIGAVTGGVLGAVTGGVSGKLASNKAAKEETKRLLANSPDARTAKYALNESGDIVKDKVAREAIKQGVDEGVVATTKKSTPVDRQKMNKMLDILEQRKRDPVYGATNRPSDVLGDSVLDRYKIVQKTNQAAARKLDSVAKNLKGQNVDISQPLNSFVEELDGLGVRFNKGKPVYTGSQIEGLKEPQRIINTLVKRMSESTDDAFDVHNLKRFIDEQVSYGKTSGGLTGKAESILKSLRKGLDSTLDAGFPEYNNVNTTYATTRSAIDDFIASAGSRFNPNDANANARIGTLMRRILSNAQSRTNVLNAMQNLQTVAEANGGKFSDDIIRQTVFLNDLERLFGTQAPTSLAGEVTKGVQKASGIIGKMKSSQGLGDMLLQAGAEGIEKARNINEDGLTKALRELLK